MPELPEVETTVDDLKEKVLNRTFIDVWIDSASSRMIKKPGNFKEFKKELKGRKIKKIWRRGKNIIFELSQGYSLLVHQKMTGHLLVGNWKLETGNWKPLKKGPLKEPVNHYIHLMFWLSGGLMLAFSDLRKFGKAELWKTGKLMISEEIENLGLEPLEKSFTFKKFKEVLKGKKGKVKQVLMDQKIIVGIGNIYASEILWEAKINPFKGVLKLSDEELKKIYQAIGKILKKAVKAKGESISDFRRISGEKGGFDHFRKVYQKEGEKCPRCGTKIKRTKIAGRSAYFCPTCQKT